MGLTKPIEYRRLTPKLHADVMRHLKETFFVDEPLNKAMKICKRGEGHEDLEELVNFTMNEDASIVALSGNGEVAGVALNGWVYKGEIEEAREKLKFLKDDKFRTIFTMLYDENLKEDIFDLYDVDRFFEIRIVSVDPKFRGQGVAKKLFTESEKLAKELGAKLVKADCTGLFSQKVTESLDYKLVHEMNYDTYKDENQQIIIPVEAPHKKLQIKCKII